MPKVKTNRAAAKRFKKTASGKIKHKQGFARHILSKKSAKRKRQLRKPAYITGADGRKLKYLLPYD